MKAFVPNFSKHHLRVQLVRFFLLLTVYAFSMPVNGQILQRLKDKLKDRQEKKVEEAEDNLVDSLESGIGSLGKPKAKKTGEKPKNINSNEDESAQTEANTNRLSNQLIAYRKSDFIRGDKIVFEEKFESETVGDYPKSWQSNGGGEIVSFDKTEGKWLRGVNNFSHTPEFIDSFPQNFTLEFDVINEEKGNDYNEFNFFIANEEQKNINDIISNQNSTGFMVKIDFYHDVLSYNNWTSVDEPAKGYQSLGTPPSVDIDELNAFNYKKIHFAFTRQNSRLKLYLNSTKIFDINSAFPKNLKLNQLVLQTGSDHLNKNASVDFSNIILAETIQDLRSDFMVSGKYTTSALLFETNSDKLVETSYPIVGMIASYLQKNPTVKLKVIGHTDNTGNANANLVLSKKRAASVIKELVDFYKIDSARLLADGAGATIPIDSNDTSTGRAKNRRVEFVKF
ncbi:MAG: OmpA family protein [Chitinophagaceae bacterium]|nr:OmpA family protein [Chitinophagaceae bacterium]